MTLHSYICNHVALDIKNKRPQMNFCSLSNNFDGLFYFFNSAKTSILRLSNFAAKSSITSFTVEIRVER